jgi:raffinose/stachyose/melibiose transport system substrate-binding protein
MKLRYVRQLALAVSAAAVLASTGIATAQQTVVKWLYIEANPLNVEVWDSLIAQYEAEHPNVDIQTQFLANEDFKAKLPTLLQSNDIPHIFYSWGGGVLKAQKDSGVLMDLTPMMDADGGAWRNSYVPAAVDGLTFDGAVSAVPFRMGTVAFFYNKELCAQAGVDGDAIKTWDDFLGTVQTLKDAGITPLACGGGDKWPLHFYYSYLIMRNGGQDVMAAAKAGEPDAFKADAFIKAGEQLQQLGAMEPCQDGYLAARWNDTLASFADGKTAMILGFEATERDQRNNASDDVGLDPSNIGRFYFPEVPGGVGLLSDTFGGLNGWAITRNAPQEAVDFMRWFTAADQERILAEKTGLIPVAIGAETGIATDLVKLAAAQLGASTWHQNFLDQDLGPNLGRVVNDVTVEIFSGAMSPQDGAQMIQDTADLE